MRFDWVRIDSFAVYTTISTSHDGLMFYYCGRAVSTEIRISLTLSWKDDVSPQLIAFSEVTSLAFHMVSRHVRLLQQVVAWSLLIDGRIYLNFAKSHNPITFIIYLLTLSWIYWSPRKATKFRSDNSTSTWNMLPVSRSIEKCSYLDFSLRYWFYSTSYLFQRRGKPHASCSHLTTIAYFLLWTRVITKTCSLGGQ